MNIFFLDKCPCKSAQLQYDKHVVKMILETAQMLSTAHNIHGDGTDRVYKSAYVNHPTTKWVRSSQENYSWAYQHFMALGNEFKRRYGKDHISIVKYGEILEKVPPGIVEKNWSDPPQAMPDVYKKDNYIEGYINYYKNGKEHIRRPLDWKGHAERLELKPPTKKKRQTKSQIKTE
eukprot:GHVP01071142.1.p1 GENE.GHVP01071142.1~~GHVP01071142.1.p1  ORF type:complete len:176 (-),score=29.59 GHVP01071142.1:179-706(-)